MSMLNEIEAHLQSHLKKGKICTLYNFTQLFPNVSPAKIAELFVNLYKADADLSFQLLCHIVISKDQGMRIQLQKFENIQKGMLLNYTSSMEPLTFNKQNVKELKIIAIFPKNLAMDEVKKGIEFPELAKTRKYVNKFLMAPTIKINKDIPAVENQAKKQQPKQEPIKPEIKQPIKPEIKPPVNAAKKEEKGNLVKKQPTQPKIQLPRVSNKQQKPAPILTDFIANRAKLQTMKTKVDDEKLRNKNKMAVQSDEELYTKQKFAKLMQNEPERETDTSGKKSHTQENEKLPEPMDIQTRVVPQPSNFIDDDDDDDALDVLRKMQQLEKRKIENPQPEAPKIKQPIIAEKPKPSNVQQMKPKQSNKPLNSKSSGKVNDMFTFLARAKKNC